ncbi:hypothetical protein IGI04_007186 [Brassica rapa subsp. trilocularis]|uniref:Retrotransposon gag domain-containing protein n=1 Tax=Brassica rapa subsp. trilocularis TaxID=1813537 RepID=A0ABQ7NIZ8_BRACM|nr:hypothetical protein IGI04_007186 [Brassica rapa subsp. trilocularis]
MPYLTNQEGLNHEDTFYGFYTQEGVQANWNWAKIFTEQEVMNFTTQRFLSPSICEYPTLEGDLSSSKERPEAKPIIGVKRSLSAFQKAQDQEKWPRNYVVMIQSPKPVKPVLHLPQLEANRFNQLQTRHWRPGDHFNQSGDILGIQEEFYKFIPCTNNHWIRRILIYSNLPYLEQTDINVQQLFPLQFRHDLSTFQAVKKVPRKLSYPLKPFRFKKDQILYLEPKFHKRLQRLVFDFFLTAYNLKFLNQEAMTEEEQGQPMKIRLSQHLVATQELYDNIAQLGKRNKPQGRRPPHGERRFGDALDAGYVEPKPPDPSWITKHQTSYTHEYSNYSYHDYNSADDVNIYSFSGSSWSSEYLTWERTMDDWFTYYGVPKKERLAHAIKQLSGKAYSWWKRVDKTHGKSPEEVVTNWEDLKDVMIRKYLSSRPSPEVRERYPRRFSSHGYKEAKRRVPKEGHRSLFHQDQIRTDKRSTVFYDQYQPYEVPKSMEKNLFSPDTLARHKEKSDKPILQGKAKVSPILDKFVYKSSPTGMSHLSLSKNVKTGPEEGLNHEANFYGFYTQEGVQDNWNWETIFTEQEVMNFTTQRFLSPSICEYPTLEEDLSSSKERPEAKPIIGVKRSLSAFQKA